MPIQLTSEPAGVRMKLKLVPGASRNKIVGVLGNALKVAVSKPPADGAANRAVVKLLADALGVAEANVTIARGHTNPRKEALIAGITIDELRRRLDSIMEGS